MTRARLAEAGELPGRKIGEQWRFSRSGGHGLARRGVGRGVESAPMARKKRKSPLRPRVPVARQEAQGKKSPRGHHHPELVGPRRSRPPGSSSRRCSGSAGRAASSAAPSRTACRGAIGAAAYVAPAALSSSALLMVSRSELVDVRPFRIGLGVARRSGCCSTLGSAHGGLVGRGLEGVVGTLLGSTGATIVGVTTLVVGALLLSGASAGALLRRSGRAVRSAARSRPRTHDADVPVPAPQPRRRRAATSRPSTSLHDYPDVVGEAARRSSTTSERGRRPSPNVPALFEDTLESAQRLPAAGSHPPAPLDARPRLPAKTDTRIAEALVLTLAQLRRRRDDRRPDRRPARHPLRAPARAGHEGLEGRRAQGRPLLRARDDRDPHPRADPRQAGRRRRGAQPQSPNIVTLGDIYDDLPATASPLSVWLGQGHLRQLRSGPTSRACRTS